MEKHNKIFQTKIMKELKSQLKVNSSECVKLEIIVHNIKSPFNVLDNMSCKKHFNQ